MDSLRKVCNNLWALMSLDLQYSYNRPHTLSTNITLHQKLGHQELYSEWEHQTNQRHTIMSRCDNFLDNFYSGSKGKSYCSFFLFFLLWTLHFSKLNSTSQFRRMIMLAMHAIYILFIFIQSNPNKWRLDVWLNMREIFTFQKQTFSSYDPTTRTETAVYTSPFQTLVCLNNPACYIVSDQCLN